MKIDRQPDTLGRRSRTTPASTGKRVTPQPRDLLWFERLAEHGPLPTSFLLAFARGSYRSEKRAKERLADLFHESNTPHGGPYLTRPPQQFRTIDSRYNQLVHDLAPAAATVLRQSACSIRPARSGPWLHSFMVSCITASIELACALRDDLAYIPQSEILARADTSLRWPTTVCDPESGARYSKDLLPDAVFGLEYLTPNGKRYRFFALEADRASEPLSSATIHRKSYVRHLLQYEDYIEGGGYREHLSLTAPMLVLNVTTSEPRMDRMIELAKELYPHGNSYQLFQTWEEFGPVFRPPATSPALLTGDWARVGFPGMSIGILCRQ